jgi:hypothetical protein
MNHLMLFQDEQAHIDFMKVARKFYRHPVAETLLLVAVLSQVISGIQLLIKKWKYRSDNFIKFQIYSGMFLAYFLTAHVSVVLLARYILRSDTNLYFGASGLNNNPLYFYFIIHYGLAVVSIFVHIACAHRTKISRYVTERTAKLHAFAIMGLGIIISCLIIYKMMHITIPLEYHFPFGKYS